MFLNNLFKCVPGFKLCQSGSYDKSGSDFPEPDAQRDADQLHSDPLRKWTDKKRGGIKVSVFVCMCACDITSPVKCYKRLKDGYY